MSTRGGAVLGGLGLLVCAPLLAGCDGALFYEMSGAVMRGDDGAIAVGGELDVFDLTVGDCFDESDVVQPRATEDSVYTVMAIPCEDPHTFEVYHVFDMPNGPYPGEDAVGEVADEQCFAEFEGFVGEPYETSPLEYWFYTPAESGWDGIDQDRMVQCFIGDEGVPVTGSAGGSGGQAS